MARAVPDGPGEPLRAAGAGHHPDPDLGLAELGVVAGHDEVARSWPARSRHRARSHGPRR